MTAKKTTPPNPAEPVEVLPPRHDARARILVEALRLFSERGFDGASMRDVAAAVSISPGNLTYHFPKKDVLFRAAVETAYVVFVDELRGLAAAPERSARDRLRLLMDRLAGMSTTERMLLKTVLREILTAPEHLREFCQIARAGHPMIILGAVQAAIAEGALPPGVGPGLVPIIFGTLVLAPTVITALGVSDPDPSFSQFMIAHGRRDLYTLLGFTP